MFDQYEQNQGDPWSIAKEIDHLAQLAGVHCWQLKPIIIAASLLDSTASQPSTVLSYEVPLNFTLITTRVSFRSIPPVNDPDLTAMDWRSDEVDASGSAKAHWEVNGVPFTNVDAAYSPILNREHILAFAGGERASLVIERTAIAVPVTERYEIAVSGYLAPPKAYDCLSSIISAIDTPPLPPGAGGAALILNSLSVINVSTPAAPIVASTLTTVPTGGASGVSGATEAIDTLNHIFYVISGIGPDVGNALQAINVSDPANPTIIGTVPCSKGDANYRTALSGDKAVLACVNTGDGLVSSEPNVMQVFDVSDPTAPAIVATYDLATDFAAAQRDVDTVVMVNRTLYAISDSTPGLVQLGIYDLTNPLAVTQESVTDIRNTGDIDTLGVLCDVITVGLVTYAVMWIQEDGTGAQVIETWNVTNPAAPVFVAKTANFTQTIRTNRWSQVDAGHLYGGSISITQQDIIAVDVSNPAAPAIAGSTPGVDTRANFSLRAAGGFVYVAQRLLSSANSRALQIYDAAVPGALVSVGIVVYRVGGSNQQLHLDI